MDTPPLDPPAPPAVPPAPLLMPVHPSRLGAGFWRRVLALFVDAFVLGTVGAALGFMFYSTFAAMGEQGRWVGFLIAGAYYCVLNSRIGGGQTLGKRLLGIEVVDLEGKHIGVARSFGRYAILGAAFELNSGALPAAQWLTPVGWLVGSIFAIIGVTTVYLFLFNTRSRRTLHDLMVGTFVVRKDGTGAPPAYPFWRGHIVILIALAVAGAGASVAIIRKYHTVVPGVTAAYTAILDTGKVSSAGVFVGTTWENHNGQRTTTQFVACTAYWKSRPAAYDTAATEIANVVLRTYPAAAEKDAVVVTIAYGYEIGIAHGEISQRFQHTPAEWTALNAGSGTLNSRR